MRSEHMLYDFTAYMQAHKDRAAERRHRGLSTGKAAKGWERMPSDYAPAPERGSFAELVARTLAHWDCARGNACDDYLRAVFPDRFEGGELL